MDLVPRIDPASVEPTRTKLVYYNPNETGFGVYMYPKQAEILAAKKILKDRMAAYILALRARGS
jgi:hypothetical protein